MNRTGESLQSRPDYIEASPGHWIEACPECTVAGVGA